jgi:multicomponent Na+:H+ antiporter subunit B
MRERTDSVIIAVMARALVPLIQLYALYVHFHGHSSPGGGFQGGALIAASVLLIRISMGPQRAEKQFPRRFGLRFGAVGVLIFAGTGVFCLLGGGNYLDYAHMLGIDAEPSVMRAWGITLIETGVLFGVLGTLVTVFDAIIGSDIGSDVGSGIGSGIGSGDE